MKKYRVSLALKIPSNFETEVRANTEVEALQKALAEYDKGEFDEHNVMDPDWANLELDIDEKTGLDALGSGIFIEEIKKK